MGQLVRTFSLDIDNSVVAVQDKCPSNCSAEMSPDWSAMVSDGDTVDATGDRRVGGFSASMYLLTVSLWIPNSLAIRRMDIPLTRIHRRTPMDGVRKAEGG